MAAQPAARPRVSQNPGESFPLKDGASPSALEDEVRPNGMHAAPRARSKPTPPPSATPAAPSPTTIPSSAFSPPVAARTPHLPMGELGVAPVDGSKEAEVPVARVRARAAAHARRRPSPAVRAASERVAQAARAAGKPVMFFVGSLADASAMRDIGGSGFVYASDQSLMRQAAAKALSDLNTLK